MANDRGRPWRCFVAVPIDAALRDAVERSAAELQAHADASAWRWTDADGWHVTLAFLGGVEAARIPPLAAGLDAVAAEASPFHVPAGGLGAFPSRRQARVLWYGIGDDGDRLRRLAAGVRAAVGLEPEDRFHAHLTLGRARERRGADARLPLDAAVGDRGRLAVDRVVLFRSHLGRGPAHYEVLAEAALRGGAG